MRTLSLDRSSLDSTFKRAITLAVGATIATLAYAGTTGAQQPMPATPPQIVVNARGEVQATPDRAKVQVGVETQAKTAAAAANENNRKQAAILAAIKALGVPAAQISTMGYNVFPIQRWDEPTKKPVIDGYRVSNIVEVQTDKLEQAGTIIDAALTNGANRVAGLDFLLKDSGKAKDEALAQAIATAKRQATTAATAAGGTLGELLELQINDYEQPRPREMMAMAMSKSADMAPTPLSEGTTTVAITVMTRWRFVAR